MRGQPLSVELENDELVIRIGIDVLVLSAEDSENFQPFNRDSGMFDQWKVRDALEFAKAVSIALHDEAEDGSTSVTRALDDACLEALESGSKADLVKAKEKP